jgi:hypothetical protein
VFPLRFRGGSIEAAKSGPKPAGKPSGILPWQAPEAINNIAWVNRDLAFVFISALVATFNPSLLAATTAMSLLPHPKRLMLGYLLGAYTTSIAAGVVIVSSLHGSTAARTSTHLLSPAADIAVGAAVLLVSFVLATGRDAGVKRWRQRRKQAQAINGRSKDPWQTRMLARGSVVLTFAVGAAVSFPGVSYVNALDHIANLNPPPISILLLVFYFCLMQQILLEGALLASTFAPQRTADLIGRLKRCFARHGRQLGILGLSVLGALLAVRGVLTVS